MSDLNIEKEIVAKGLTAPRLTPTAIQQTIVDEAYHRLTDTLTVCVLTLRNGFTVTGESACASPENFNEEIGNKIARENAIDKIWQLEGYLLKQDLYLNHGDWKVRLENEYWELDDKINKLNSALNNNRVPTEQAPILFEQLGHMTKYHIVLKARLDSI